VRRACKNPNSQNPPKTRIGTFNGKTTEPKFVDVRPQTKKGQLSGKEKTKKRGGKMQGKRESKESTSDSHR